MLDLGASPNYKDLKGLSPLYYCVTNSSEVVICELLLHDRSAVGATDLQGKAYCVKYSTFEFHAGYQNEITYCGSLEKKKKLHTGNKFLIRNFAKKFHIFFDLFLCICMFCNHLQRRVNLKNEFRIYSSHLHKFVDCQIAIFSNKKNDVCIAIFFIYLKMGRNCK